MPRVNTPGFHSPRPRSLGSALTRSAPWMAAGVLVVLVIAGLTRDPPTVVLTARLAAPSARLPFGADALGRDLLARFGHGGADRRDGRRRDRAVPGGRPRDRPGVPVGAPRADVRCPLGR